MDFYSNSPRFTQGIVSVGQAMGAMKAFNALYEMGPDGSVLHAQGDNVNDNWKAGWRNAILQNVINIVGEPMELDFFEAWGGGKTPTPVDATNLYVKSNVDVDMNIMAQASVTGNTPGADAVFTVHRTLYAGNGKLSNIAKGGTILVYEDDQWLQVIDVDTSVDFAHRVTVRPRSKDYTVNIRQGKKMLFSPVNIVSGSSCPNPSSTWLSNGYISKIQPFRIRKDYSFDIDLTKGYQDVLQFAIMFDPATGKEIDSWELKERMAMRSEMKWMKNITFFAGQKIDNPTLLGAVIDEKYAGFDGYLPTLKYGGGVVYDYDPSLGYDLNYDFKALMLRQDANKMCREFLVMHGMPFKMNMEERLDDKIKNSAGSCTFNTFNRMGNFGQSEVSRMGIESYKYGNFSLHFKEVSALSDTRGIGNYKMPYTAMMIPGTPVKDSKGNPVPAIQTFMPHGATNSGTYEEFDRDKRRIDGCEKLEGHATETLMLGVHAVETQILLNPVHPF